MWSTHTHARPHTHLRTFSSTLAHAHTIAHNQAHTDMPALKDVFAHTRTHTHARLPTAKVLAQYDQECITGKGVNLTGYEQNFNERHILEQTYSTLGLKCIGTF